AFYNKHLDLTPETVGRASLFHTAPGVHCTAALVAHALDDRAGAAAAAAAFVAAARQPCPNPDLALGRSGLLLGSALLAAALEGAGRGGRGAGGGGPGGLRAAAAAPPSPPDDPRPLLAALGDALLAGLWAEIEPLPPIPDCAEWPNLGMAHGWAGYLYATL